MSLLGGPLSPKGNIEVLFGQLGFLPSNRSRHYLDGPRTEARAAAVWLIDRSTSQSGGRDGRQHQNRRGTHPQSFHGLPDCVFDQERPLDF